MPVAVSVADAVSVAEPVSAAAPVSFAIAVSVAIAASVALPESIPAAVSVAEPVSTPEDEPVSVVPPPVPELSSPHAVNPIVSVTAANMARTCMVSVAFLVLMAILGDRFIVGVESATTAAQKRRVHIVKTTRTHDYPASMQLQPGDTIGELYLVERHLGGGGMGSVYLARDTQLGRQVAIKLLHEDVGLDEEADARFQREAQVMSRVVHPNVVAVYGFGQHRGAWYISMEYVEGEDLDDLLEREEQVDLQQTVAIARQVASGLAEAHAHGIVHRDIKPGNVLLRRLASGAMLAKVVDFGIARGFEEGEDAKEAVTDRHKLLGTPAFMAPEQIQQAPLNGQTDQYALAVMTFQMLTGDLPIYRKTIQGMLLAHLVDTPDHLHLAGVGRVVNRSLDRVLQTALSKSPDERFGSVIEFAEALEKASGIAVGGGGPAVPCPSCSHMGRDGAGYCERCGSALPLSACPACASPRHGERYFCSTCGTSLLTPGRQLVADGDGAAATGMEEAITAVVIVARLAGDLHTGSAAGLLSSFAPHVEREGGRPLALLGSECVAAFGIGGMREGEMQSAIDTALALQRVFQGIRGMDLSVTLHVGVALGSLRTRGLGFALGTAFAVGDAVDLARNAAHYADDGAVLITESALREVRGIYELAFPTPNLARVKRHRDVSASFRFQRRGTLHDAFVARSDQVDIMMTFAERCRSDGKLHAIPLLGEAGSGKSRLLGEWIDTLQTAEGDWQLDAARCSAIGIPVAYEPFVEILRARAGSDVEGDEVSAGLTSLPGLCTNDDDAQERVVSLGRMIGVDRQTTLDLVVARPATAAERTAAFDAFTAWLRASCEKRPEALVLADMQWAKPTTMELLAHIVRQCDDVPLLLVLPMRDERAEQILSELNLPLARTQTVSLRAFDADKTAAMVSALLGGIEVPDSVCERVHDFAQGNPGRIEEAVEALAEHGVFRSDDRGWRITSEHQVQAALDRSLSEVVLARIGRVPPAERAILQVTAVAGNFAPLGMISAMLQRDVAASEISQISRAGYILPTRRTQFVGETEFRLRQRSVAEIIVNATPPQHRSELHRRAARWLMDWVGPRPPGFGAMLAHHFMFAGDDRNAAQYLVKTALDALRAFANRDAYDAFAAAVEVAGQWHSAEPEDEKALETLIEALLGQAEIGFHLGQLEAARTAAERAEDLTQDESDAATIRRARAFIVQGEVATRFGEYHDAIAAFGFAAAAARAGNRGRGLAAVATGRRALVLYRAGEGEEAEACARAGLLAYSDAVPTPDVLNGLGRMHTVLGHTHSREGNYARADSCYEVGRDLHERAGDKVGAAMLTLSMGNSAYRSGDLDRGEALYREAATTCAKLDYMQGEVNARNNLAYVHIDRKRHDLALVELEAAEALMRDSGLRDILPDTLRLIAQCRLARGNTQAAIRAAKEAVEVALDLDNEGLAKSARDVLQEAEYRAADPGANTTIIEG